MLALLGIGQAVATLAVALALTLIVAGSRGQAGSLDAFGGGHVVPFGRVGAIVLLAIAFVARAGLSWAEQVVAQRTAARVTDELRRSMLAAALRHGPAWIAHYGSGRLAAVLGSGLDALRPWFSGYLPSVVLGVALPPLVLVAIAVVDPGSAVIALLTLPLIPVLGALIGWATQARARQRWDADARLAGYFLDVVRGLATLRLYGRAERQIDVVAAMTDRHRAATMRVLRVAFLSSTALDLVGTLSVGLIAVEAGLRVAGGSLGLAPALLVILLAPEVYRPLREMAARYHASTDASAVIADADEVLAAATPTSSSRAAAATSSRAAAGSRTPSCPAAGPATDVSSSWAAAAGSGAGVAAAGLRVRYPESPVDALRLGSLTAPAGRIVALRGPSGAGKSTTLRVLAGLQPADAGTFRVNGPRPLYLPQRPVLPHARTVADAFAVATPPTTTSARHTEATTVSGGVHAARGAAGGAEGAAGGTRGTMGTDNGTLSTAATGTRGTATDNGTRSTAATDNGTRGTDSQTPDRDSIRAALRAVGLDGEVEPDTPLGEYGHGVSAGQRQRIALAALLFGARREPVTLLLDEPTAHLDAVSEHLVIAELRAAADRGCAVLAVAHRPALIAAADAVVDVTPPRIHPLAPDGTATNAPITARANAGVPAVTGPSAEGQATTRTRAASPTAASPTAASPATARPATAGPGAAGLDNTGPNAGGSEEALPERTPQNGRRGSMRWASAFAAAALGAAAWLAGIVLTGAAAWLLVRASTLPPVLTLSAAVVLVRASAVARPLLRYLERLVAHDVAFARLGARRAAVFAGLIPLVPGPALGRRGDLLTRVVDDVDAQVDGLLRGRLPAVSAAAALGVASAAAVLVEPALALPLGVGLAVAAVLAPAMAARQAARQEQTTARARAELRDAIVETVDGAEELATRDGALDVPDQRSRTLARLEAQAAGVAGRASGLAHLGWGVAVAGAAVVLGSAAGLSHEAAAVLLLAIVALAEPLAALPDAAIARRRARGATDRLAPATKPTEAAAIRTEDTTPAEETTPAEDTTPADDTTQAEAATTPAAQTTPADPATTPTAETAQAAEPTPIARKSGAAANSGLVVRGLVAGWDPARAPALKGLTLAIPEGRSLAVLGRSGSGKSTLAAVLAGLLAPRAGTVTFGGVPVRKAGLVSDDADHLFATTLRENLRLARPDATDDDLSAVLDRVGLIGWGDRLSEWIGATTVSGGERRRLATARALLADPRLLILDEPTEGLDEPAAEALMADLLAASGGRTVLLLTHRTEGLDRVDECLALTSTTA